MIEADDVRRPNRDLPILADRAMSDDVTGASKRSKVRHRSIVAIREDSDEEFANLTPETRMRVRKEHRKLFSRDDTESDSSRTSTSGSSETEIESDVSSSSGSDKKAKEDAEEARKKRKRKSRRERAHRKLEMTKSVPPTQEGATVTQWRKTYERSMSVPIGIRFESYGSTDGMGDARRRREDFVAATKTANEFEDANPDCIEFNPCRTIFGNSEQSLLSPADVDVTDIFPVVQLSPKAKPKLRPNSLAPLQEEDDDCVTSSTPISAEHDKQAAGDGAENVAYLASEQSSIHTAATPTEERAGSIEPSPCKFISCSLHLSCQLFFCESCQRGVMYVPTQELVLCLCHVRLVSFFFEHDTSRDVQVVVVFLRRRDRKSTRLNSSHL